MRESPVSDVLLTALAPVSWGTTYVVTTSLLPQRPLLDAALRALPAGAVLIALSRWRPPRRWWPRLGLLAACNIGVFFAAVYLAASLLPGTVAAIILASQPALTLLLAWALLAERPAPRLVGAAAAGLAGVAIVVLRPLGPLSALGLGAALVATVSWSLGTVLTARWGRSAPLLGSLAWQLVLGGAADAAASALVEGPPPHLTAANVAGFAYMGAISTALAYALWFRGLTRLPANAVAILALLSPVVATLIDVGFLGRRLTWIQALGVCLVLAAVVVGQRRRPASRRLTEAS
jgi:probable blue pigment (indigoidine) exporter